LTNLGLWKFHAPVLGKNPCPAVRPPAPLLSGPLHNHPTPRASLSPRGQSADAASCIGRSGALPCPGNPNGNAFDSLRAPAAQGSSGDMR